MRHHLRRQQPCRASSWVRTASAAWSPASNPILGYSYLGPHNGPPLKEYFTVERTVEFLQNCERAGITTHQFADPERALQPQPSLCLLTDANGPEPHDRGIFRAPPRTSPIPRSTPCCSIHRSSLEA